MRHTYIVTYDICDPKRLRKVYKFLLGHGEHIQLSVFSCELNDRELAEVNAGLSSLINSSEDQVLFASIGPSRGRALTAVSAIGKPYEDGERLAIVV